MNFSIACKASAKIVVAIAAATSIATVSQAGTQLRLNHGTIETSQVLFQQNQLAISAPSEVREYIVQFKKSITEQDRKQLGRSFQVFGYLPEDALVVRGTFAKLQEFQKNHPQVQAVLNYEPAYKLSPDLAPLSVFSRLAVEKILIRTFDAAQTENLAKKIESLKSTIVEVAEGRSIVATVPRGQILNIADFAGIEHIQPNPVVESFHLPMDPVLVEGAQQSAAGDYSDLKGDESGTRLMNFEAAWSQGFAGRGQTVSMADTGLDSGVIDTIHKDFSGGITSGHAFGLWSKTWDDPMGHGTHVAGSVMSRGTASNGLLKGGAYDANMVAEGMWSPMLNNLSVPNKLTDLFAKAYADGARVHTNSWGAAKTFGSYDNFAIQVDEWSSANPDMLILFAAGNSGVDKNRDGRIDENSMASPGTAKNVLTVGASENVTTSGGIQVAISKLAAAKDSWSTNPINSDFISNNAQGMAMFSSRGPTQDGRTKPDIVAPGTNILSVRSQMNGSSPMWGAYNADYVWAGGTSMATPLTAGAVAVLRQVMVEKLNIENPSAALMKATMLHTAVDLFPGQYGEGGVAAGQEILTRRPNSVEGYGRVDVGNIMKLGSGTQFIDNRKGVKEGDGVTYEFTLAQAGRIYANLVWTDVAGSPNAALALVNDLDLTLTMANGSTVGSQDRINNLESIERELPAGSYKLTVKGHKVPQAAGGAQSFALVFTAE